MAPFKSLAFDNGLQIAFIDLSNRYFGDYHRILIEVRMTFVLPQDGPPGAAFWQQAQAALGECLTVTRTLERMGVPTDDVETVRDQLAADFISSAGTYLQHPEYLQSLVAAELRKRRPGRVYAP